MWKMSIQYMVLGFEPTTLETLDQGSRQRPTHCAFES